MHWPDQGFEGLELDFTPAQSQGSSNNNIKRGLNWRVYL